MAVTVRLAGAAKVAPLAGLVTLTPGGVFPLTALAACNRLSRPPEATSADHCGNGSTLVSITDLIEATVMGAHSRSDAKRIAMNIINSPLIKTAVHGADPNWGRIVMAIGKDPHPEVDPEAVDLFFGPIQILSRGAILPFERSRVIEVMKGDVVPIIVNLNLGPESATAFGCDLTKRYIEINTEYS